MGRLRSGLGEGRGERGREGKGKDGYGRSGGKGWEWVGKENGGERRSIESEGKKTLHPPNFSTVVAPLYLYPCPRDLFPHPDIYTFHSINGLLQSLTDLMPVYTIFFIFCFVFSGVRNRSSLVSKVWSLACRHLETVPDKPDFQISASVMLTDFYIVGADVDADVGLYSDDIRFRL